MFIISKRKIWFILSSLLVIGSIFAMVSWGFNFSTDFKGGSIVEINFPQGRPEIEIVRGNLDKLSLGNYSLRPTGERNIVLRSRPIELEEKSTVLSAFSNFGKIEIKEERFNSVGPIVGESLKNKSFKAIIVVIIAIVLFITFAFRKVSEPVASWKYGLATIIALAHDVIVPTGAYILFGKFTGAEVDLLFVTALLAILGYSVHDTIVVFDRVREHLRRNKEYNVNEAFEKTVGESLYQTIGRSINTSLTVFVVLVALYLLGGEVTRNFTFVLIIGIVIGTYSSIFIASPLLVVFNKRNNKK